MSYTPSQDCVPLGNRFRGFCPVVVDVETGGFNASTDALLEVAAVLVSMNQKRQFFCQRTIAAHVRPFEGANLDPASLEVNGIDPFHPLRIALPEEEALQKIFAPVHRHVQENQCTRAILVGHNAFFDLGFIKAAVERTGIKNNPFHPFSNLDTVTLGALAYGQTVLSRIAVAANLDWESSSAHSAVYDAEKTAEIFCEVMNRWEMQA
ncbi:MAG: ribonuclease T [Proteobacteria bacterium]|nr:ribonuclease T [Pseudomonadota bacterium]